MRLQVTDLASGYRNVAVLREINFQLKAGEIVGLIGLNGAGKSTLLKTILGLITPQAGEVRIDGISLDEDHQSYARQIAYIPETPILYEELTLREHLEMTALGYGIPVDKVMRRAQPLLEMFRLDQHLNWFPEYFSKGMKQKVMVVCALVTDAIVFIIDEPFLGLDPIAIRDLQNLMRERAAAGAAVLFTTHVLSIADDLCDRYLMLSAGHLVAQGDLPDLRLQFNQPTASLDEVYMTMSQMQGGQPADV